ncbi:hypothetical protein HDU67_002151, partial [Dinochytrium kinnereticum]
MATFDDEGSDDGSWETFSSRSEGLEDSGNEEEFENVLKFWFPGVSKVTSFRYTYHRPKTLREQTYISYLSEILNKPRWWEKIADKNIVEKWKAELQNVDFSLEFLMRELEYISSQRMVRTDDGKRFWPLPARGAFISDDMIDDTHAERFSRLIRLAEEEALHRRRWHPGSDGKVLDIFHPSNYSVVYGKTKYSMTPNAIFGEHVLRLPIASKKLHNNRRHDVSAKFQWLPSEFEVDEAGKVKIVSYINNLNPSRHSQLYCSIAGIFQVMLPMFERAIGALHKKSETRIHYDASMSQSVDDYIDERWEEHKLKSLEDRKAFMASIRNESEDAADGNEEKDDDDDWLPDEDEEEDLFK